ncbi:DNA (cytosine-5)-methyltransferase 3A-like, partial [Copidosoma floridanum]|uniref:DNA (cytosine-5)-methyltransferase 3A-like n=1 Tax=Copidosoma floridanum TaxID=29053 RepID=UPI000C6F6009
LCYCNQSHNRQWKKKIRVLSLFDGISTGLVALKNLNFDVDCYYSSEIDTNAIMVSQHNHGDKVIQLGDVRKIDETTIRKIVPIHLLLGGSPCNELSSANPKRRGLDDSNGTGILFYEYHRILELLRKYYMSCDFFWLFENVSSMTSVTRDKISKILKQDPLLVDSAEYSTQRRKRLFWTNFKNVETNKEESQLQQILDENFDRQALVRTLKTITTSSMSLAKNKVVTMNGKIDFLWVTEIEKIFYLPQHYTDVANLNKTARLNLLGKAWCVKTIMFFLRTVQDVFERKIK